MTPITRETLIAWAAQHRQQAADLRSRAERLLFDADQIERKAACCERDAEEWAS